MKYLKSLPFALFLCFLFVTEASATSGDIRVGLYFDDTELTSANLANETGSGFRFGYYKDKTTFVELGSTSETSVTMVIGTNVYLSGTTYYTSAPSGSSSSLGCYHAVHSTGYSSYAAAKSVANSLASGFVAWIEGDYQVRSGTFLTSAEATAHANAVGGTKTVAGTSGYSINMVKMGTTELIFQYDGGSSNGFGVLPDTTNHADPTTWFKNTLYRGGFQYQRLTRGNLTVTNILPLETYVRGVIPYEMSPSWPLEALKAQTVCARTYGALQMQNVRHSSDNFDLCNNAHCQVYRGLGQAGSTSANSVTDQAVSETANMFLWNGNSYAETYYSSSHGGASEAVSNVWGSTQSKYPYLSGVLDPYEHLANNVNFYSSWTVSFTKAQLNSMLQGKGYGVGTSVNYLETQYSDTGNVISLIVHWDNGKTNTITPAQLRYSTWFALPSIHFTVNQTLPTVSQFTVLGSVPDSSTPTPTPPEVEPEEPAEPGYYVNESTFFTTLFDKFALSSWNSTQALPNNPYVITGKGDVTPLSPNTEESNNTRLAHPTEAVRSSNYRTENGYVSYYLQVLSGSHKATGDNFVFNGAGWGHNIGLSQYGAYAMALHMDYSYDYILEFYFPGTDVRS